MQVVNYINAKVFNSSYSAYSLMIDDRKYLGFAYKMIEAKNTYAYRERSRLDPVTDDYAEVEKKIKKYEGLLFCIQHVKDSSRSSRSNLCW